jgi:hypothetical protein
MNSIIENLIYLNKHLNLLRPNRLTELVAAG